MSIEKALQDYLTTNEVAEKDLNGIPSSSRPGWEGLKREARDSMATKFLALQRELELGATSIGIAGDDHSVQEFVKFAEERSDTVSVSRNALYATIAARVYPHIGETKQFGPSQFNIMLQIFRGMVTDMGLSVRIAPQFKDVVCVNDTYELSGLVQTLIEDAVGDVLVVRFLRSEFTRKAIEKRVSGEKVFVVVVDGDHQTMESLSAKSLAYKVSPPVTGESVSEVFDKLLGRTQNVETIEQQPQTKKQKKQKKEESNDNE